MQLSIETRIIRRAEFEIWVPPAVRDKVNEPQAIVVLTSGSNGDGRGYVHDHTWQEFAVRNNAPLIGTFFQDKDPTGIEGYCKANEESGECLLWAVRYFEDELKLPLEQCPLLLYGFSAGGQFNYEMNASYPRRVGAFVVNKGGIYYTALVPELARMTPGLFFTGKKDSQWRQDIVKGLISVNRRGGCKWFLVQEDCAHAEHNSERMSRTFFEKILKGVFEEKIETEKEKE